MRVLIEALEIQFAAMESRRRELLDKVREADLFWTPISDGPTLISISVGGSILRSAAMVEQAFLGITRRLWDDPFEWTLPEKLSSKAAIAEYMREVEETRRQGLLFLASDDDLSRCIPAPEKVETILSVLVDALTRSENYLGRAETILAQCQRKM